MKKTKKKISAAEITEVERAIGDLRRGQIVAVKSSSQSGIFIVSPENLHPETYKKLHSFADSPLSLVITHNRAVLLAKNTSKEKLVAVKIDKKLDSVLIEELSGIDLGSDSLDKTLNKATPNSDPLSLAAIKLAKLSELLPSLIIAKAKNINAICKKENLLSVNMKSINSYESTTVLELREVSDAPIKLLGAEKARIVSFRPADGGKEHHAIVIGKIDKSRPVPVRVHSSCYTGDLLSSLRCDCREQLHKAIDYFGRIGGGIVLYLMQEGRGIGLINKLRAYKLQYEYGMDTVDANEFLGFEDDERPFGIAAEMLKKLGIGKVSLMTNNPKKIHELEKLGVKIESYISVASKDHKHVHKYLSTKSKRLNHMIKI